MSKIDKQMKDPPKHVALILDGNRRWARERGLKVLAGHRKSATHVEKLLDKLLERGVKTTTLWVFSTENWKRDQKQINGIMDLAVEFLEHYRARVLKDKIRVVHLGRKDRIPLNLKEKIEEMEEETKNYNDLYLNLALDYGGRDELIRAVQRIQEQDIDARNLTEENFNDYLDTNGQPHPEPDLIIRSGGAKRMSGFMPWQGVYSEYAFTDTYFPDITPDQIDEILDDYENRERRFGGGK